MAVETETHQSQSLPNAAQIPLQTFHLPTFPRQSTHLKDLTLTSDINPTEYANLLTTPLSQDAIPTSSIPTGIDSLTLELFSLGYPPSFLTRLARALPRLKALTLYCHLIDGISDESRKDASEFFNVVLTGTKENGGGLRRLHLLDVFCRRGLVAGIGGVLQDLSARGEEEEEEDDDDDDDQEKKSTASVQLLEVSYTYRGHSDASFLERIPADELPEMLAPGLVAVSFRLEAAPADGSSRDQNGDIPDDPADVDENGGQIPGARPQGIIPLRPSHLGTGLLAEKLIGVGGSDAAGDSEEMRDKARTGPRGLKMLDCTLYTLSLDQMTKIIESQRDLAVLSISVLVQETAESKKSLLNVLQSGADDLETVEIVGVPEETVADEVITTQRDDSFHAIYPSASDMDNLSAHLPRLSSFSMTILRAPRFGLVTWTRARDGEWKGGVVLDEPKK